MPAPSITYPLDLTGNAATNFITGEIHTVNSTTRAFVPTGGPFYTKDMVLRKVSDNSVLFPTVHYKLLHLVREASKASGKEVCSVVYIEDPAISGDIRVDYHVIGGDFTTSVSTIQDILDQIDLNDKPVYWGDILNKPYDFPPQEHLQSADTIFGMDETVAALERIKQAIQHGDQAQFAAVYQYINNAIANLDVDEGAVDELRNELMTALDNHITNSSAHTPGQVGLGNVSNWVPGTTQDHTDGTVNRYATTAGVKGLINTLNTIIATKANTADIKITGGGVAAATKTVDGGGKAEFTINVPVATAEDLNDGLTEGKVVVPKYLKPYIDNKVTTENTSLIRTIVKAINHGRVLAKLSFLSPTTETELDLTPLMADLASMVTHNPFYFRLFGVGGGGSGATSSNMAAGGVCMGGRGGCGARGWCILPVPSTFDDTCTFHYKIGAGAFASMGRGNGYLGQATEFHIRKAGVDIASARWYGGRGGEVLFSTTPATVRLSARSGSSGALSGSTNAIFLPSTVEVENFVIFDGPNLSHTNITPSSEKPVNTAWFDGSTTVRSNVGDNASSTWSSRGAGGGGSLALNTSVGVTYKGGNGQDGHLYIEIITGTPDFLYE